MQTREIDWKVQLAALFHVISSSLFHSAMGRVSCCCTTFKWKTKIEVVLGHFSYFSATCRWRDVYYSISSGRIANTVLDLYAEQRYKTKLNM